MWNRKDWQMPTTYAGPYAGRDQSDILVYAAFVRAARDGHFAPFTSKFVPELGAPYEADWNDWPYLEYVPLYLIGVLARAVGIFASLNLALLMWHLFSGLCFYCVARYRQIDIGWSFTAALAFGLASFIFSQSPDHPMVALCWHVPLFLVIWAWLSDESGIAVNTKRFWFAIAVGFLAGLLNPYYSVTFCQIVLFTAGAMFLRTRKLARLLSGLYVIGATVFAFVLINLNAWLYQARTGQNHGAIVRQFQWVEIYALKALDLFVPPFTHQWALFRQFAQWRWSVALLHDEGSYLGILGAVALVILVVSALFAAIRSNSHRVPAPALQILWIFVFFSTGGLNAIGAAMGFTYLRAGCRLSVVILAVSLLYAAEWINRRASRSLFSIAAVVACSVLIFFDQVPKPLSEEERAVVARAIDSDKKFVAEMEAVLPEGAMIFQLPVMDFPESPLRTETSYDHLRPYLYSRHLRFSFGSMKGRRREQWQHDLEKLRLPDVIAELKNRGFAGIYVSRPGYSEGLSALEQGLQALGTGDKIESGAGDLFFVRFQ
jgi:phosphoglycerol transferase